MRIEIFRIYLNPDPNDITVMSRITSNSTLRENRKQKFFSVKTALLWKGLPPLGGMRIEKYKRKQVINIGNGFLILAAVVLRSCIYSVAVATGHLYVILAVLRWIINWKCCHDQVKRSSPMVIVLSWVLAARA